MYMPKKSVEEFFEKVLESVGIEAEKVGEIAERAGTSWESTRRALEVLEKVGVVKSVKENGKKLYFRVKPEEGAFFNIPLRRKDRDMINFIFDKIREIWKEKTGENPGKTVTQKILVRVNNELGLGIPVGRYLYGTICVQPFEAGRKYEYTKPEKWKEITQRIREAVNEYSGLSFEELKLRHYRETENKLYELKEGLIRKMELIEGKEDLEEITEKLLRMVVYLPEDREVVEAFVKYIEILNRIKRRGIKVKEIKPGILESFEKLWEFMATKLFYTDLLKFYLPAHLELLRKTIEMNKFILKEYLSDLRDLVPYESVESGFEELKKLQGSAKREKKISKKELRKLAEETAGNSEVFREFGLD